MSSQQARPSEASGRPLGPKAASTRRKLLEGTAELLAAKGLRELRVVDVARRAGTSPATFYQYFQDVQAAVLALARDASGAMPALIERIDASWQGAAALEHARAIAEAFVEHWDAHHAVLRARNQASDEGDPRFQGVRAETMGALVEALARKIRDSQADGQVDGAIHPAAAAAAVSAILERLAAYHRELALLGVTRADLVETSARLVVQAVTGRRA